MVVGDAGWMEMVGGGDEGCWWWLSGVVNVGLGVLVVMCDGAGGADWVGGD